MFTDFWYFRYFSLRIISFRIQKIPFRFKAKQAKLTFFSLFRFAHFCFRFASFEMRGHPKWKLNCQLAVPNYDGAHTWPCILPTTLLAGFLTKLAPYLCCGRLRCMSQVCFKKNFYLKPASWLFGPLHFLSYF